MLANRNQRYFCPGILNTAIYFSDECLCDNVQKRAFAVQGGKALINWVKPTLKCTSDRQTELDSEEVDPPVSPPQEFGVGRHTVKYTYRYMTETRVLQESCSVIVNVEGMYDGNRISSLNG